MCGFAWEEEVDGEADFKHLTSEPVLIKTQPMSFIEL